MDFADYYIIQLRCWGACDWGEGEIEIEETYETLDAAREGWETFEERNAECIWQLDEILSPDEELALQLRFRRLMDVGSGNWDQLGEELKLLHINTYALGGELDWQEMQNRIEAYAEGIVEEELSMQSS